MKKDKQYYLDLPYEIAIRPLTDDEGGGYFANYNHKDLQFIIGDGKTYEEALQNVRDAFSCYLDVALKKDNFIPEPNYEIDKLLIVKNKLIQKRKTRYLTLMKNF